jgi:mono/diheme cytochrome c family protein
MAVTQRSLVLVCLLGAGLAAGVGPHAAAADAQDPHAPARAILAARCVECHGVDAQESNLRLDSRAALLKGGDFGPAAVAGKGAASELIRRITTTNPEQMMPPDGERLSKDEVAAITAWIDADAPWPGSDEEPSTAVRDPRLDHWAWQPIVKPPVPDRVAAFATRAGVEAERNAIDFFIRATLAEKKLSPSAVADRRTLIRRLSFDLTGLPPTPEEVDAFVADADPAAYEKLVDRLLASPRYGERWARHWLDVVHYGDTHGYDKDKPRPNAWPYRDYVIRSLNADKPYARFIEEQIAGDVLFPDTIDGQEAIGFIAAGPWDLIGHLEVPETKTDGKIARHLDRDDMVANTIGTFTSVTIHCAQCHNHKFDPITQDDYYSLQAVFAAIDRDDRKYSADLELMRQHAALDAKKQSLEARSKEIEAEIAKAAGPRLAELDKLIKETPKLTDGNPGPAYGYHSGIAPAADTVKWVQVDLGRELPIKEIVLHPCFDNFNEIGAGFGFPLRYRVEVANDPAFREGVTTVAAFADADLANPGVKPQSHSAGGVGRYVRVTATKLAPRSKDFIFALAELKVFGTDGANLAAKATITSLDSIEAPPRWARQNLVDGESPAEFIDKAKPLRLEREALMAKACDPALTVELEAVKQGIVANATQQKALSPLSSVYAATTHKREGKPRTIHVLSRGSVLAPTHEARPGALAAIEKLPSRFDLPPEHAEGDRRVALAHWIASPANPLTWRSIVNRVWQYHFGRGIVGTASDFGRMGAAPTHPHLLDWLAAEFRDSGGSLKSLHRRIVTSATYRQASASREDCAASDADNQYLWRQNRRKIEAEAVRDAVLVASGTLDLTMGGPGWQDFRIEHPQHSPHYRYDLADPEDKKTWRRGVYRFVVRSQTQPFMTCLDCADPSMRVEKRNESISALQALALLNNGFMVVQARQLADRVVRDAGDDPAAQVKRAFELAVGRDPDAEETVALVEVAKAHGLANVCRAILNLNEFSFVD